MTRRKITQHGVLKAGAGAMLVGPKALANAGRAAVPENAAPEPHWTEESDVIWTTPSADASGAMPLGNGEVGICLWAEPDGGLHVLVSRTDSFSEIGRIVKVGGVRVSLAPNPFAAGASFRQALHLRDGLCEITAGVGAHRVTLRVFVDADAPVVHCVGTCAGLMRVTAQVESWRTEAHTVAGDEANSAWTMNGAPFPLVESADVFRKAASDAVCWYHRNEVSTAFTSTLENQSLTPFAHTVHDPLLHRTFGGWLTGPGFSAMDETTLGTPSPVKSFALRVAAPCLQAETPQEWIAEAREAAARSADAAQAQARTAAWWRAYWDRAWVVVRSDKDPLIPGAADPQRISHNSGGQNTFPSTLGPMEGSGNSTRSPVTLGYTLQRYMQACGGRGRYPIKFNGGIFTVSPKTDGENYNHDWRRWGDPYWYQNTRHMYHPMPAGGDSEMMAPFFRMYQDTVPLAEERSRLYYGASGAYFPETMTVWGTYANSDYGWDRHGKPPGDVDSAWIRWYWNQGPELVALMLDRWDYTRDEAFARASLLPVAVTVLTYFDTRFPRDDQGRVRLDPTQVLETFQTGAVNDMPTVAGLREITARLCALPADLTTPTQRAFFARMQSAAPLLPVTTVTVNGKLASTLAPAQQYDPQRSNCENPELYAVWPFRHYGVGRPEIEVGRTAYHLRVEHLDVGWGYDGNCAALLGLADEAARILRVKCANSNPNHRWPATWGPNFDWLPDQNHGGNLLETTQLMLLQPVGRCLHLLPAWPKDWDVYFKLHAPMLTTVECVYRAGHIERLEVTPAARRADVVLPS